MKLLYIPEFFVADSEILAAFGAILSNTVFELFVRQTQSIIAVLDSAMKLF